MNLFGTMDTSGGAMQAERMRAEVVAANMANAETTRTAAGTPYKRQHVVFAANNPVGGFLDSMNTAAQSSASGSSTSTVTAPGALASGIAAAGGFPSGQLASTEDPALSLASLNLPGSGSVAPGVHIAQVLEDPAPPLKRYDPGHPDAGPDGYVSYPDINPLTEMVDLMGATRAHGLNSSAVQAEKGMIVTALDIAKS
jgi:flagellar basal-body rod protein FlgC